MDKKQSSDITVHDELFIVKAEIIHSDVLCRTDDDNLLTQKNAISGKNIGGINITSRIICENFENSSQSNVTSEIHSQCDVEPVIIQANEDTWYKDNAGNKLALNSESVPLYEGGVCIGIRVLTGESQKGRYVCEECKKIYTTLWRLKMHERLMHTGSEETITSYRKLDKNGNPFKCKKCLKVLSSSESLSKHELLHIGVKSYFCEQCGKSFTTSGSLKYHLESHNKGKLYMCEQCEKTFVRLNLLNNHITRMHSGEKRKLMSEEKPCPECSKTFGSTSSLNKHRRSIHSGVKPYICELCGYSSATAHNLAAHIQTHEKPYICQQCGKGFKKSRSLTIHIQTHKQHVCELCNCAFVKPASLALHKLSHTSGKPYVCKVCSKAFSKHRNLKDHSTLHT